MLYCVSRTPGYVCRESNPLYELVNTTRILPRNPQPVSSCITHDTHSQAHSQWHTTCTIRHAATTL